MGIPGGAGLRSCAAASSSASGNANRDAARVVTGEEVEIELDFDPEPPRVTVPEDFARALDADPAVRAVYDGLTHSRKWQHESAKGSETRKRRIETALAALKAASR
jgi:uncharacterized protein YdeI (YjbR/CyaY-like superfamily)